MNDVIYNLLLTGELGFSLAGILRYRVADTNANNANQANQASDAAVFAATADAGPHATEAPMQAQQIDLIETPLQGSLVVSQLTGLTPVPLSGFLYSTAAGPLSVILFNVGSPEVLVQCSFLVANTVAGGVSWRPSPNAPVSTLYSLLGRRVGIV